MKVVKNSKIYIEILKNHIKNYKIIKKRNSEEF